MPNPAGSRRSPRGRVLAVAALLAACRAGSPTQSDPGAPESTARGQAVASVSVTPGEAAVAVLASGETLQLQAVARDAQKRPLQGRAVTWASGDPGVVRVDASGRVTAVRSAGPVRVTATVDGVRGVALISVPVYRNDFGGQGAGPLTRAALDATWNSPGFAQGVAEGRVHVVSGADAYQGGQSMRVSFPKGAVGPGPGGALWVLPLGQTYRELYASYRLKFGPGFQFVRGGKLPGLAGGAGNTGGNRPNGHDGWSGRIMWSQAGRMLQYVYHPDQAGPYGESMAWSAGRQVAALVPDRWYHVETRVVMNTPGSRDGIVQTWLDGVLVLDRSGVRFRDTGAWGIDAFHMTTFFGGNEPAWAPQRDEVVYFDDFVISTVRGWHVEDAPAPESSGG